MEQILKRKVEEQFKGAINTPKDCNQLAILIAKKTNRKLSSSTLRRIFGLLPSETKLSKYNLDTLAIFCGSADYNNFCKENRKSDGMSEKFPFLEEIHRITQQTLKNIANKSLTPFKNTIPRKELNRNFDAFLVSDYAFFPMTAPGGYGKSIALAHWVAQLDSQTHDCFYCTATIFFQMFSQQNTLFQQPDMNFGTSKSFLEFLKSDYTRTDKKLIIVLDGIDELSKNSKKTQELIDFLFDIVIEQMNKSQIKIIISTREITWVSYISDSLFNKKFSSFIFNNEILPEKGVANLLTLSNDEIRQIIEKNSEDLAAPIVYGGISWVMREMIRIPINLHLFIFISKKHPEVEIITSYRLHKEYLKEILFEAKLAEQKEDIIWKMIEMIENKNDGFLLNKNDLKNYYPIHLKRETEYFQAYQDLLFNGILAEEREENKYGIFITTVRFKHQDFFYYFSTINQIRKNKGISFDLFLAIAKSKNSYEWIIFATVTLYEIAYFNEDYDAIENFCQLPEFILDSLNVQIAVGNSFRMQNKIWEPLMKKYAASSMGQIYFFEYFVDTNYLQSSYCYRIKEYLLHKKTKEAQLFGNSILFLSAFLKMDAALCHDYYSNIQLIIPDSNIHPWPLGRKVASIILYSRFILDKKGDNYWDMIMKNRTLAYNYQGYLNNGLVEFELPIMVSLIFVRDFTLLYKLLENIEQTYKYKYTNDGIRQLLNMNQNSLPILFLEYAKYKLGKQLSFDLPTTIQNAINNYSTSFDDFQYLILLNWFLCDYHLMGGKPDEAYLFWCNAIEITKFAEYDFYTAYLLINNPKKDTDIQNEGFQMIDGKGFKSELFLM